MSCGNAGCQCICNGGARCDVCTSEDMQLIDALADAQSILVDLLAVINDIDDPDLEELRQSVRDWLGDHMEEKKEPPGALTAREANVRGLCSLCQINKYEPKQEAYGHYVCQSCASVVARIH